MPGSNDIRAGSAYVELGIKGNFQKDLNRFAGSLKSFGDSVTGVGKRIGAVGALIITPLLAAAAAYGVMGKELQIAAEKTGFAVESLSQLKFAADESGAAFEDVTNGIRHMQKSLADAANGNKEVVGSLNALHITLADLRGLKPEDQFNLIATRLAAVQSASQRAALAQAIFGRGGVQLLPLMQHMQELELHARDLGIVMSTEDAQAATKFADTMEDVEAQTKAVTFQIGAAVAQALQPFAASIRSVLPQVIAFTKEHRALVQGVLAVGVGLTVTGGALVVFGQSAKLLGSSWLGITRLFTVSGALLRTAVALPVSAAVGSFNLLTGAAGLAGSVIATVFGGVAAVAAFVLSPIGLIVIGLSLAVAAAVYFSGVGGKALGAIGNIAASVSSKIKSTFAGALAAVKPIFNEMKATATETFQGIADALAAGNIQLAGRILWTGLKLIFVEGRDFLRGVLSGLTTSFITTLRSWATPFAEFASNALDVMSRLGQAIKGVWENVVDAVSDAMAEVAVKSDIASSITSKYGGKTLTDADTRDLAAPEMQRSNNAITAQAEKDASARGLTGKAYSDAVSDQALPLQAQANKQILESYKKQYAGRKLSDDELQRLIEQQTSQSMAYMRQMRQKDRDAREAAQNEELSATIQASKDRIAKLEKWKAGDPDKGKQPDKEASDLQAELDKLVKSAGEQKKAADAKSTASADAQRDDEDAADKAPATKSEQKSIGLFNVAGIAGLNVGGYSQQDRIAAATEETAKNTRPGTGKPTQTHAQRMADLAAQNRQASPTGYAIGGRAELTDATKNADGTFSVKSRLTGISATLTADQLNTIRQAQAIAPRVPNAQYDAGIAEAVRRRSAMTHASANSRSDKDKNGERVAKATEKANMLLEQMNQRLPNLRFS